MYALVKLNIENTFQQETFQTLKNKAQQKK